jgi:branched-subunit amino acid transport protein
MEIWLTIIGMGIITYSIRFLPIALLEKFELSPNVRQALKYVPVAVLTAIIVPELLMPDGTLDISLGNGRLIGGIIAGIVAWKTKNVLWTIVFGMGVLWLIQWIQQ